MSPVLPFISLLNLFTFLWHFIWTPNVPVITLLKNYDWMYGTAQAQHRKCLQVSICSRENIANKRGVAHEQNTCHASFISRINTHDRNMSHAPFISNYSRASKCLLVSTRDIALSGTDENQSYHRKISIDFSWIECYTWPMAENYVYQIFRHQTTIPDHYPIILYTSKFSTFLHRISILWSFFMFIFKYFGSIFCFAGFGIQFQSLSWTLTIHIRFYKSVYTTVTNIYFLVNHCRAVYPATLCSWQYHYSKKDNTRLLEMFC